MPTLPARMTVPLIDALKVRRGLLPAHFAPISCVKSKYASLGLPNSSTVRRKRTLCLSRLHFEAQIGAIGSALPGTAPT